MTEKQLLEKLNIDPENGMRLIMQTFGGAVQTICRNFLYDCAESDIEEAMADTFINFWKNRSRVIADINTLSFGSVKKYSLKSYIYAIARNAARDKRRSLKKHDIFSLDEIQLDFSSDEDIEEDTIRREQEMILHECLEAMDEPGKSIFLYRYFYGFKVADIAAKLNLTPKQVDNHLYRGKDKLKAALAERGITHA